MYRERSKVASESFQTEGNREARREHLVGQRSAFLKLLCASFISQSGSHFLTIALAGFVFSRSGSITRASLMFILSYLPAIFVGASIGQWVDLHLSRWLLVRNEILAIVISALCGTCIAFNLPLGLLCGLVALRSLLLFTTRSGGIKWIKLITPIAHQSVRIKFFYLSFFLSTAVAGILAATALRQPSVLVIILIDVGTYLLSIVTILTLPDLIAILPDTGKAATVGTLNSLREIFSVPSLSSHFTAVCLSQAIFQGAYSVLVYYLPLNRFQLGFRGLGLFQIAASLGITLGFLILWRAPTFMAQRRPGIPIAFVTCLGIGLLNVIVGVNTPSVYSSFVCFFLFNSAYECIWLYSSSEFVQLSPQDTIARFQFLLTACASCSMAGFTLFYAVLIQLIGLQTGVLIMLLIGLLAWACISRLSALHNQVLELDGV
jgi:hypothetical protein